MADSEVTKTESLELLRIEIDYWRDKLEAGKSEIMRSLMILTQSVTMLAQALTADLSGDGEEGDPHDAGPVPPDDYALSLPSRDAREAAVPGGLG
jgi:hypothetical protein